MTRSSLPTSLPNQSPGQSSLLCTTALRKVWFQNWELGFAKQTWTKTPVYWSSKSNRQCLQCIGDRQEEKEGWLDKVHVKDFTPHDVDENRRRKLQKACQTFTPSSGKSCLQGCFIGKVGPLLLMEVWRNFKLFFNWFKSTDRFWFLPLTNIYQVKL